MEHSCCTPDEKSSCSHKKCGAGCAPSGAVYGLGIIGAAIYYVSTATGFWMGALGILKAFVWPAILVHAALRLLGV